MSKTKTHGRVAESSPHHQKCPTFPAPDVDFEKEDEKDTVSKLTDIMLEWDEVLASELLDSTSSDDSASRSWASFTFPI